MIKTENTDKKEILESKVSKIREEDTSTVITASKLFRALKTLRKADYIEWHTIRENGVEYFEIRLLTKDQADEIKKKEQR